MKLMAVKCITSNMFQLLQQILQLSKYFIIGIQRNMRSICFTFLLLLSFRSFIAKAEEEANLGSNCVNSTQQTLSSAYQTNLDRILTWMPLDAATSHGYNHTTIGTNSSVYGLYDCGGDAVGYFCQFCVSTAANQAPQLCPNRVSAVVWNDYCVIRYSNEDFFGKAMTSQIWHSLGTRNISNITEIQKGESFVTSLIRKATNETNQLYYKEGFNLSATESRYSVVQCTRDLTNEACRQCLEDILAEVPKCCEQKVTWMVWSGSCLIRYDDHMFYLLANQPPSAPEPNAQDKLGGNNRSKILIITFSVVGPIFISCFILYCFCHRKRLRKGLPLSSLHKIQSEEMWNPDLPRIPLITILQSTDNFSEASKLGEGGFGPVYKGTLPDGKQIAVKRLSQFSGQGSEEFNNEVMFIAKLRHRNLVRLLACCSEEKEKILVYEYLPNKSLDFHLFDVEKRKQFDWKRRSSLISGIAKGILYLHEDSQLRVIHRDLKASNVLLDHDMNPKISDFGLARAFEVGQNQANTKRVMGTYGYMAPEYAMEGLFSVKSDVFSFGVLVLEIISGRKNGGFYLSDGENLLVYALRTWYEGKCLELMDSMLEKSFIGSEVERCIQIGLLCVQEDARDRPTMSDVVVMLASDTVAIPKPRHPAFSVGRTATEEVPTSRSSKKLSISDITISITLPR
ncbi:cysteine-rich receptor-like protein kinase 10 isoform X2 [Vigna radiata var. radiata]|uniref:Cysteine-rich receptor-like protein kinase 10 isoform X2 n=1 Tax=Vigna radiata var. radiata TaxID=3916 RepID=A0A1S3TDJ1_VIGRR|nr:cysteine-rich receptor-like protein kinase 10 isoform X2 [Vigna radiata var. radiata]